MVALSLVTALLLLANKVSMIEGLTQSGGICPICLSEIGKARKVKSGRRVNPRLSN